LCDACDWDENANIGAKYLRVMRSIIELSKDKDHEEFNMVKHYDIIAIVI